MNSSLKSTRLSTLEILAIQDRCASASAGPWQSLVEGRDQALGGSSFIMTGPELERGNDIYLDGATIADQDFIASARQDVPRLVEEVFRLRALLKDSASE